jgi:hypothetical protein
VGLGTENNSQKFRIFASLLKTKFMATEINRAPVLKGKAAKEFWQKVEKFTANETKTEITEGLRKYREFMSKQRHYPEHV